MNIDTSTLQTLATNVPHMLNHLHAIGIPDILHHLQALVEPLMHIAGQVANGCGPGDVPYTIQAGEWITGLARQVAQASPGQNIHGVLNSFMASNNWPTMDAIPSDIVAGQQICMRTEFANTLQTIVGQGTPAAICPDGGNACYSAIPTATSTLLPNMAVMDPSLAATATGTPEIAAAVGPTAAKGLSGWLALPAVLLLGGAGYVGSRFLRKSA
jgi:hypothetical protein